MAVIGLIRALKRRLGDCASSEELWMFNHH